MQITWNFPIFLGFWLFGILVLFLWLKNKNSETDFKDVLPSLILGAAVGFVAAYAGDSAHLDHWILWIVYAGLGFYITYRFLNKQYTTKSLAWLLIGSLLFSSCSSTPNDARTTYVKGEKTWKSVPTGKVNQFGNPELQVIEYQPEYAEISPTWGQAFYYAFKAGYIVWFILSFILLGFAVFLIIRESMDKPLLARTHKNGAIFNIVGAVILAILAGLSFYGQPSHVKWSNKKLLDQSYYEQVVREHGSSKPIWDSLYVNHLILGSNGK